MKKFVKIFRRVAGVVFVVAVLLNLIWNAITCLNVEPACEYINSHALKTGHGNSASHVLGALNAGGKAMVLLPAWTYKYYLHISNFDYIEDYANYVPKKGDVVVFPMTLEHLGGHIAIWNGKQWVSDFKQESIYVDEDYKNVNYIVFRNVFK